MLTFLYRLFDENDNLLYVGITRDPNTRFDAHAIDKSWWPDVARHQIEEVPTPTAFKVERAAIKAEHPRHNVSGARSDKVAPSCRGRMPTSLADAAEFLRPAEAVAALGIDSYRLRLLETNDPTFPRRRPLPFAKLERFSRRELIRWAENPVWR